MSDQNDPSVDEQASIIGPATTAPGGRRRAKKRRNLPGCLAVLVALATIVGGLYFVASWGIGKISDQFAAAEDFGGPGTGEVTFEVVSGDSSAAIGRRLKEAGVVASVEAFTDAAGASPDWANLQPGFFSLKKEMAAADVVAILVNPANMVKSTVTIPEGLTVADTVAILAEETGKPVKAFEKVLADPARIDLPDYADGNAEGYLFPATYDFGPNDSPVSMLAAMVARWRQAAQDADLEGASKRLGYSPAELMTIASLIEAEGRGDDMPKIARVIYNRLTGSETNGLLQIDATVNYAADNDLGAVPTEADLQIDSPYNTYANPGLPPGPIEAPGDAAIQAATNPAEGDWYYYVTVNLETGETKFAETYDEFLEYKAELRDYCENESGGAC